MSPLYAGNGFTTQLTVTIRLHLTPATSFCNPTGATENGGPRTARRFSSPPLLLGLLGLPEDLADLVNLGQQIVGLADVRAALSAASARQFGGVVEQLVQLRVLLKVRWLEVVRPQHPQVMLDELGPLLLDVDRASAECGKPGISSGRNNTRNSSGATQRPVSKSSRATGMCCGAGIEGGGGGGVKLPCPVPVTRNTGVAVAPLAVLMI